MDRSTPGSWVLHSPSPLGTAAADAEAPGREPQQLRCGAQDPDFQHGGAHSHGEEADNPGPSSCPMPCLRQNWATPDAGRRQPPSSFPLPLSLLGRSDLWGWGRTPSQRPLSSNARRSRDPGAQRHTERRQAVRGGNAGSQVQPEATQGRDPKSLSYSATYWKTRGKGL